MIKKLIFIVFSIVLLAKSVIAGEVFKITSVNFDTSNSMIFLSSPDNTTDEIIKKVKLIKLSNPKRVYFDIDSAVLASGAQNWFLNSGGVKQVKISQFSSNPAKIRIVLYLDENFNQDKISYLKVNNNLVLKFSDGMLKQDYFQNTYRDEKNSSSDFYENLSISNEDLEQVKTVQAGSGGDLVFNQIQQSFSSKPTSTSQIVPVKSEVLLKELRLKSKYYMNSISLKDNGFLLSGVGSIGIEKPMYFTNPARVAFDVSNVLVSSDIKNKDYKLGVDILRVNQIEANKARIQIVSPDLDKYYPIFSADGQSVLFTKSDSFDVSQLFTKLNDALSYEVKRTPAATDDFLITFNSPVVHSVKREPSRLIVNFYNTLRFNEPNFKNAVVNTNFEGMTIDLLPKVGLKLVLPVEKNALVKCFIGADGKTVKISMKGLPARISKGTSSFSSGEKFVVLPKCKGKRSVVLDAGHGGTDYGAIRAGINEKDINLDIVRRVQALLSSKNVSVALSRDSDTFVSLQDRTLFCASSSPDIFVSVHVNSSLKPEISGIETHYYHPSSLELASVVHASLVSNVKAKDRGLFKSKFYVINHTEVPAILVEIGFISNDNERTEMINETRKQQTAKAIADGILKYLNSSK